MWEKAFPCEELPLNQGRCFSHASARIGIFRTGEGLFAIDNTCPHYQVDLHQGEVKKGSVRCPWHRWRFHLKDGRCDTGAVYNVNTYPVKEEDGFVWVNLTRWSRVC